MEQIIRIKCPHCGWIRRLDVQSHEDIGVASVTRDIKDEWRKAVENIRNYLSMDSLDQANAWIDMPTCSNCSKTYRYNVQTREVKP